MNLSELRDILLNRPKYNNIEKKYIKEMKISACKLMQNYDVENAAEIDMQRKREASYPPFLWQETLVNQFNLFVTMLGVLDARIINYRKMKKLDIECDMSEIDNVFQKRKLIEERLFILLYPYTCLNSIRNSLKIIPCDNNAYYIYKEMETDYTQLHLHMRFLDSYNTGYSSSSYMDLEKIIPIFELVINEVDKHEESNKTKLQEVKIKCLNNHKKYYL